MLKKLEKARESRSGPNPALDWSHAATAAELRTTLSCLNAVWLPPRQML